MGRAWDLVDGLDRRGGMSRLVARTMIGAAKSVKDTSANRQLSLVRWSPARQAWVHRWRGGRVVDRKRWSTPEEWATKGDYDMPELLWSDYRPKQGDTVVDVGAGHGGETFFLASMVGKHGRVLAIEAAPAPFGRLQEMVEINGWTHVHPIQVALSDHVGTVTITNDEANWIAANIYADAEDGIDVPATTFDDLCAQHGIEAVDWVKMNIEGAEKDALRGMERMAPHVGHMTIACHDWLGTEWGRTRELVLSWLHDHGFQTRMHGRENTWDGDYVHAWRD